MFNVTNAIYIQAFDFHPEGVTYSDFKQKAEKFEQNYHKNIAKMSQDERFEAMQADFWAIVDNNSSELYDKHSRVDDFIKTDAFGNKQFEVNYAADLNTNEYGRGFPSTSEDPEYGAHPWNFRNLNFQEDSLLQFSDDMEISGINVPWLYMGMLYSSF